MDEAVGMYSCVIDSATSLVSSCPGTMLDTGDMMEEKKQELCLRNADSVL